MHEMKRKKFVFFRVFSLLKKSCVYQPGSRHYKKAWKGVAASRLNKKKGIQFRAGD